MNRFALVILVAAIIVGAGLADDDEIISTSQVRCDVLEDILLNYGDSPLVRAIPAVGDSSDGKWLTVNDTIGGLTKFYGCPPASIADVPLLEIEPVALQAPSKDANVTFPPPVYVVRDDIDIRGTVASPDLMNFFIEFRPLMQDLTTAASWSGREIDWVPATLPRINPVRQGVLGRWNTKQVADGVYELRLTINGGTPTLRHVYIGPIRVEKYPPIFADLETDDV